MKEKIEQKKQYSIYKEYLNRKNKKADLAQKYKITDKCILLCPSYYDLQEEEDNVIELRFPALLNLYAYSLSCQCHTRSKCNSLITHGLIGKASFYD